MSGKTPALLRELLDNLSGSEELACAVIDEFLLQWDPQLQELRSSIEAQELARTARAAHRFKGSLAAVCGLCAATSSAGALESAALRGDTAMVQSTHASLVQHAHELVRELRAYREQAGLP